ncbi:16S rRNA (cytidine(1402)-2'-O)-methyltransferase [Geosporobacter ferrireducens]|uniref:Ribosomal RNA small subunit methyltransferase I n=1 Tax=Geosporobacter ferrireducens TaxID=1424294 RepID=A0A1D8GHA9_9FIRM|nr:16S rRNA (cytidine(1402)-2'-O)-methyltransferase [Geosporobacter ferrireducens]AOT70283.1 16S rRNA (cytidine(1402)-2'-O)-methyltransferase [Geosporobacter ferrireducens]MTI55753.1 16S rRNA (cytidine(1402)-2'-O)-methyltransferase [Geosporobacter ferrireducens]
MKEDYGKLYICPTPIGNLEDITLRVLRILKEVDLIAAEDTRHTIKLLNHYDIQKPLTSYHEHNREGKGKVLLEKLIAGENIALVSDAGMPGISDPGADLVKLCVENEVTVEVLPGAAAFVTALVASGLSTDKFTFEGFLDRDKKKKKKRLEAIKGEDRTLIFYEAPHRIRATLQDLKQVLGNRHAVVARELTKKHEEILRGELETLEVHFEQKEPKGEMVLMVAGANPEDRKQKAYAWENLSIQEHLTQYLETGMDKKEAIKTVAKERGIPKREVYECSIHLE